MDAMMFHRISKYEIVGCIVLIAEKIILFRLEAMKTESEAAEAFQM